MNTEKDEIINAQEFEIKKLKERIDNLKSENQYMQIFIRSIPDALLEQCKENFKQKYGL